MRIVNAVLNKIRWFIVTAQLYGIKYVLDISLISFTQWFVGKDITVKKRKK